MPSFDVVSKIDMQEIDNAVNSVLRELTNRYDFKGANFSIELKTKDNLILIACEDEYKLGQISDSLKVFCVKRGIDPRALDFQKIEKNVIELFSDYFSKRTQGFQEEINKLQLIEQ